MLTCVQCSKRNVNICSMSHKSCNQFYTKKILLFIFNAKFCWCTIILYIHLIIFINLVTTNH